MGEQEQSDIIDDEESGETLLDKVEALLKMDHKQFSESKRELVALEKEIERLMKMFYLRLKVQGQVKDFRKDYFV